VRLALVALGVVIVGFALLSCSALALAQIMPFEGEIAYYSSRAGNLDLFLADVRTGREFQLTRDPADDLLAAWSPDGQHIAFVSLRDGNFEIYVMNADGGDVRRLTHNFSEDTAPVWSPDGTRLAFDTYSYQDGDKAISILNLDGSGLRRVRHSDGSYSLNPVWSPDSARVAFYADDRRDPELFIAHMEDFTLQRLTRNQLNDWKPVWSPDGRWLAYYANPDENIDLFALDLETGMIARLTYHLAKDWMPAWAPDGTRLAFLSERGGKPEVYVLDTACFADPETCADRVAALGSAPAADEPLAWSPDSARIAYVSALNGNLDIHLLDARCAFNTGCDTSPRPLTVTTARDRAPVWRPQ